VPRPPDADYPHLNKKKVVVIVVVGLIILLLAALWAVQINGGRLG
jgi:hypothetical protein